jgi:hypothetical protein
MGMAGMSGTFDRDMRDIGTFGCPFKAHLDRDIGTWTYPFIGYVPMPRVPLGKIEEFSDVPLARRNSKSAQGADPSLQGNA